MKEIKPTTKADIDKTVKQLYEVVNLIDDLITRHNILRGTIDVTFSKDFAECNKNEEYMKVVAKQFHDGIFDIVKLRNHTYDLSQRIQPELGNNHWEDLADPFYDKTKGPQN